MEYNWTLLDREKELDKLVSIANAESDPMKRSYYFQIIDSTRYIIENDKALLHNRRVYNLDTMHGVLENFYNYKRYFELIYIFSTISKKHEEDISLIAKTLDDLCIDSSGMYLSDEDAVSLVHDFYINTDSVFSKLFMKLYKDRYTSIKFEKKSEILNSQGISGVCYFTGIVNKNHIIVEDENGLNKLIDLAHECGHAVSNLYNPDVVYNSSDYFLTEVSSIFFELAFHYEIASKLNSFESAQILIEQLDSFINISYLLSLHEKIINVFKDNNYKLDKNFYGNLKRMYKLSKNMVLSSINTDIVNDGTYTIDYMVALSLFNIYKQDKKSAFELLRKIIDQSYNDSYQVLSALNINYNCVPGEINNIINNMNNEIKKVLKL